MQRHDIGLFHVTQRARGHIRAYYSPAGHTTTRIEHAYLYTSYAEARAIADRLDADVMRADIGVITERAERALLDRR